MKKLSILKWMGEALIIFISVIGAFWVENYREAKNRNDDYVETLLGFRNNVHKDILDFRSTWDKSALNDPNFDYHDSVPFWVMMDSILVASDSILNDINKINDTLAYKALIQISLDNFLMPDNRSETPYLLQLREFPQHVRIDSLENTVSLYSHHMRLEFVPAAAFNKTYEELFLILKSGIDFNEIPFNLQKQINVIHVKNLIRVLINQCKIAIMTDRFIAKRFSSYVTTLDNALAIHDVDTSKLDKAWLVK